MSEKEAVYILLPDTIPALRDAQNEGGSKALEVFGDFARRLDLDRPLSAMELNLLKSALHRLSKGEKPINAFLIGRKTSKRGKKSYDHFKRTFERYRAVEDLMYGADDEQALAAISEKAKHMAKMYYTGYAIENAKAMIESAERKIEELRNEIEVWREEIARAEAEREMLRSSIDKINRNVRGTKSKARKAHGKKMTLEEAFALAAQSLHCSESSIRDAYEEYKEWEEAL